MELLSPTTVELITGVLSFLFTIALLSYLIGDNPLYRLALHIFIGVSVSYVIQVVIYQVLRPRLITPLLSGDPLVVALSTIPLVLFIFLILKLSPRTAAIGNISIAFLVGVGTAVAVGGALIGTLIPQIRATWLPLLPGGNTAWLNNIIMVVGTITTLLYFQYWLKGRTLTGEEKRSPVMKVVVGIGQVFLVLTLGTVYGGLILSGIAVFGERLMFLYEWVVTLVG